MLAISGKFFRGYIEILHFGLKNELLKPKRKICGECEKGLGLNCVCLCESRVWCGCQESRGNRRPGWQGEFPVNSGWGVTLPTLNPHPLPAVLGSVWGSLVSCINV